MGDFLNSELNVGHTIQVRPALNAAHLNHIDLDLMHILNILGLRTPHPTEPADCTVLEVVSGDTTTDEALDELQRLINAVGDGHTYTGSIAGVTDSFSPWRLTVRDGEAAIEDGTVTFEREAIVIERPTLEEWVGRPLTGDEVIGIAQAAHMSTMPDVIDTIAARIARGD